MEILKCWKLECPLLKKTTYLTFSIIETTTQESPRREGLIGLPQKCSLYIDADAGLAVCSDCTIAAKLTGLPINLK